MGRLLLMAGNGDRALETFTRAQEVSPEHPHVAAGIAESRAMIGDLEGAQAAFNDALTLAPGEPDLIISLARVQDARGNVEVAGRNPSCGLHQISQPTPALAVACTGPKGMGPD